MDEAAKKKSERALINEQIGERVGTVLNTAAVDESRVSRCLTGDTATFDLVDAISDVLGIPSCVYIAESLPEARQLASIHAEHAKAARIEAAQEVTRTTLAKAHRRARAVASRHGGALGSPHGEDQGSAVGRVVARRRGPGRG